MVPEPLHLLGGQAVSLAAGPVGLGLERVVRHRIDEQLERDAGTVPVAGHEAHHRRDVAPGAVAADRYPLRVAANLCCVRGHPEQRGIAVLDCCRELALWGEPVAHGDHDASGAVGEELAGALDIEIRLAPNDPPSSVEVDEHRQVRLLPAPGSEDSHRDQRARSRDDGIPGTHLDSGVPHERRLQALVDLPRALRCETP